MRDKATACNPNRLRSRVCREHESPRCTWIFHSGISPPDPLVQPPLAQTAENGLDFPRHRIRGATRRKIKARRTPSCQLPRDYGLFAVNPLGAKGFEPKGPALNFTLDQGASATFHYRIFLISGNVTPDDLNHAADTWDKASQ
jgi:hypothetical protein